MKKDKFTMATTREVKTESATAVSTPESPYDRMNIELRHDLRLRFSQEAAGRDMKKRDLVNEIFEYYFSDK